MKEQEWEKCAMWMWGSYGSSKKWLKKQVGFGKIAGTENTSDLLTKGLGREKSEEFVNDNCGEFRQGRAGKAVGLQRLTGKNGTYRLCERTGCDGTICDRLR